MTNRSSLCMAGVIGLVQALAVDDSMSHKHVEQLCLVEETALQVLNMINLSSELFKIETGHFKLDAQPVKIGDILRRIVEISRTTFAEKHLVVAVDTDVKLLARLQTPGAWPITTFAVVTFLKSQGQFCEQRLGQF